MFTGVAISNFREYALLNTNCVLPIDRSKSIVCSAHAEQVRVFKSCNCTFVIGVNVIHWIFFI